jgi:hypothetical protein
VSLEKPKNDEPEVVWKETYAQCIAMYDELMHEGYKPGIIECHPAIGGYVVVWF